MSRATCSRAFHVAVHPNFWTWKHLMSVENPFNFCILYLSMSIYVSSSSLVFNFSQRPFRWLLLRPSLARCVFNKLRHKFPLKQFQRQDPSHRNGCDYVGCQNGHGSMEASVRTIFVEALCIALQKHCSIICSGQDLMAKYWLQQRWGTNMASNTRGSTGVVACWAILIVTSSLSKPTVGSPVDVKLMSRYVGVNFDNRMM